MIPTRRPRPSCGRAVGPGKGLYVCRSSATGLALAICMLLALPRGGFASCNVGYTPEGQNCTACVAGKYKPTEGSDGCTDCSAGTYSEATASACSDCPAHTYSPGGSPLSTSCTCNRGYHGPDGGPCAACGMGTYKDTKGSAPCTQCPAGKRSEATGMISEATCANCPADSYNNSDNTNCQVTMQAVCFGDAL